MSLAPALLPIDLNDPNLRAIYEALLHAYSNIDPSDVIITADDTVADTTTETTVFTKNLQRKTLSEGVVISTRILGRYSTANGTDTFTARLKVGGTTVDSLTSTAATVTNGGVDIEFVFTVRTGGASGALIAHTSAVFNDEVKSVADTSTTAVDTTSANDITLTIEWSAADAGNTFTISQGWTELKG